MDHDLLREQQYEIKQREEDKRKYKKENYLRNGNKSQGQYAQSSFNTTIEEPGTNESGIVAKKRLLELKILFIKGLFQSNLNLNYVEYYLVMVLKYKLNISETLENYFEIAL